MKGTQTGVATDINGRFEIKVDDEPNLILQFSFVGMKTKEIKIGNNQELKVVLESAAESLDEVIVTVLSWKDRPLELYWIKTVK